VISNFAADKMIQFIHNIDQINRERYLSESKKVPRIQRKKEKEDGDKSKDSILPVSKVILLFPVILVFLLIDI
jgi:hypothetical protein